MTQFEPYLRLKRLLVESNDGVVVYDETFHEGLNIIRGNNSSGKSTIANFIFYSLGGDFKNWTPEAKACRTVYSETDMSGATVTLRRHIAVSSQQSMDIFWGSLDEALVDSINGWKNFPYRQSQSRESFSTAIFEALRFPEVTTAEESKITMHQVLRLLYIDQDTPSQNLFRFERFDQPITRRTVAELLLGVYDDSLYVDRLSLKFVDQEITQKEQELNAIKRIFTASGQEIDSNRIAKQIQTAENELTKIQTTLAETRERAIAARSNSIPIIAKLNEQLGDLKQNTSRLYSDIKITELDIADSKQFIEALKRKLRGLQESITTHQAFGELILEFCPVCLNEISREPNPNRCSLCHHILLENSDKTFGKRLAQEIRQQIRESEKLLKNKDKDLLEKQSKLKPLVERLNLTQKAIDVHERDHSSTREQRVDDLLVQKGRLESQLEDLARQLSAVNEVNRLSTELQDLASEKKRLKDLIEIKQAREITFYEIAMSEIEVIAKMILHRDLAYQDEFKTAETVGIDFANDSFGLDGQNSFSASSLVYLKNAIRFAIFFASLRIETFRYPRFILCDNTEDKGMQVDRSQNFQRIIQDLSKQQTVEHQIILTTSMIDPTLDNGEYCIGEFHTVGNKTLKMAGVKKPSMAPSLPLT